MKTCSLSAAKGSLGKLADEALKGRPTVIPRGGRLVILQAYEPPDSDPFDELIEAGKESPHRALTPRVLGEIWARGRRSARRAR
jgi:hypothetical protein